MLGGAEGHYSVCVCVCLSFLFRQLSRPQGLKLVSPSAAVITLLHLQLNKLCFRPAVFKRSQLYLKRFQTSRIMDIIFFYLKMNFYGFLVYFFRLCFLLFFFLTVYVSFCKVWFKEDSHTK